VRVRASRPARFAAGPRSMRVLSFVSGQHRHRGGRNLAPLKSPEYFARVFLELGAPTWPNGFDLDPINLYMELRDAGALKHVAPAK
jgi:hypothetical protein